MGTDKGLIPIRGKRMIQYVIEAIQGEVQDVVIISGNSSYEKFGLMVIADRIKNQGPAGGVLTALEHARTEKILIAACDMPGLTTDAARFMISKMDDGEIVIPVHHDISEPLFGIYSKSIVPQWKELVDKRINAMRELISYFDLHMEDVSNNQTFNSGLFNNINSKMDMELLASKRNHEN